MANLMPKSFMEQKRLAPNFFSNDFHYVCVITREKIHWARVSSPVELIPIFNTPTIVI
jgi:hypothetical protein